MLGFLRTFFLNVFLFLSNTLHAMVNQKFYVPFKQGFTMQLYVGNLEYSITEDDLKELFSSFGVVDSAIVIKDKQTRQSKGFGFVEMPSEEEADAAVNSLNNTKINGRTIAVNKARPRVEGGSNGGFNSDRRPPRGDRQYQSR